MRGEDGSWSGISVELWQGIAADLGIDTEVRETTVKGFGGDGKAHRGIGSGLWWSAVTMTTVGYGDLAPRSLAGRLLAIAWMFVSLFLVSWFTASMASILTAERLDTGTGGFVVRGADDLRHLHVAVMASTSSEDYLRQRRIAYIRVPLQHLLYALLPSPTPHLLNHAP